MDELLMLIRSGQPLLIRSAEEDGVIFVRVYLAPAVTLPAEHTNDCSQRHEFEIGGQYFADVAHCRRCNEPSQMDMHSSACICGAAERTAYFTGPVLLDSQMETAKIEKTMAMLQKAEQLKDRLPRWLGGGSGKEDA